MNDRPTVAVIGAGIAGLTVGFELLERSSRLEGGIELICLEAADRPGGAIRTLRRDGFACERGPNGFPDNAPATITLVRRLELQERVLHSRDAAEKRFVLRKGKLRPLPRGPGSLLTSGVLSPAATLRLLVEPLVPGRRRGEETVFDFMARRLGRQAASVLGEALVAGVYGGDSRELSLRAAFPEVHRMEAEHGSLFRAMLARRRRGGKPGAAPARAKLTSFRTGLQELTDVLAGKLRRSIRLGTAAVAVGDLGRRGFRVHPAEGAPLDVDSVVLACPAWAAAGLLSSMDLAIAEAMTAIPWAPLAVVHLGYRAEAIGGAPQGFGFLVPPGECARTLGTIWASSVFAGRAPEGHVLMTSMIGGVRDPAALELDDSELVQVVKADLKQTMGVLAPHHFVEIVRHRRAIPQYTLDHLHRVSTIEDRLAEHPGLFVCGYSYRGVSVNACIEEAPKVAEAVLAHLTAAE